MYGHTIAQENMLGRPTLAALFQGGVAQRPCRSQLLDSTHMQWSQQRVVLGLPCSSGRTWHPQARASVGLGRPTMPALHTSRGAHNIQQRSVQRVVSKTIYACMQVMSSPCLRRMTGIEEFCPRPLCPGSGAGPNQLRPGMVELQC